MFGGRLVGHDRRGSREHASLFQEDTAMETTNTQITVPAVINSSCRGKGQGVGGLLGKWRGLVIAGVVAVAAVALALGQHWLAAADLAPLLLLLPCAAMMLMCMKGNYGQHPNAAPASTRDGSPKATDNLN
jgi:hypothetical protein